MCLSLVRTKAPPLPGLTCWKSTIRYGWSSKTILRPFLNSAVETSIAILPSPSQTGAQRLLEPLARPGVFRILPQHAGEHVRRLVQQPLLEAEGAEGGRHERIVAEDPPEPAVLPETVGPQQAEEGA